MYRVLKPIYHKTRERMTINFGTRTMDVDVYAVSWEQVGVALSMTDAKGRFGGYPVLEAIK